ncbi:MAG TPA: helix-turn-helix domain-containing protein [Bryobacteraceae bacterium]|nr:helix-turn-helix domain-containing protein [Bryobacteraceae bacterium]
MRSIQSRRACQELRPYVRAYAQRKIADSSIDIVQPMPASLESIIELDFGNPPIVESSNGKVTYATRTSIVGQGTYRRHWIRLRSPVDSFGIFFEPMGIRQLFGIPARVMMNQEYAAADVIGKSISLLWERMAESKCFDARVRIVEGHLIEEAAKASTCTVLMASARQIFRDQGAMRVRIYANDVSLSVRQYERRFVDEIGMTPKLFARITRFQMAMDAKLITPALSWLTIAHEFGYHDQMHMIKDFQKLSGDSPSSLLSELGDMRPEALAASAPTL